MGATATLTFDDEFNTLSLWNGTSGTWYTGPEGNPDSNGYSLTGNGEQGWYINSFYAPTSSVVPWAVNNGILTITGAPAAANIQPLINGYQYTTGQINTEYSFSQTYGYFEERAQLPSGQGTWPAFWLLDENGSWPPEIDVLEELGNNPSTYYTTVHDNALPGTSLGQGNNVVNTSTGYHTYGVDWEPDFITFYFDGQKVFQEATPADMNQPMFLIASLALGGYWPGNIDPSVLPAQYNIDWIRAYSSMPSWIANGSDPTDVNHTPAGTVSGSGGGTTTGGSSGGSTGGTGSTGGATVPTADSAATFTVPAGVTSVVLIGTGPQTITANNLGDTITSNNYGSTIIGGTGNDTLIAGHQQDILTGGGGSDTFVFNFVPWSAGHITDFTPGTDKIDLSAVLSKSGYTGTNPIADGWISLNSDGAGNTLVYVNTHDPANQWPSLITVLNNVAPTSLGLADFGYGSSSSSGGTTSGGTTTGGTTGGGTTTGGTTGGGTTTGGTTSGGTTTGGTTSSTPVLDFMATYTVPAGVTNITLAGTSPQTITANNQGDTITSNDYGSTIIGGTGNDTLIAGHQPDTLTGGAGSDTFVFNFVPWSAGHITDFTPGMDKINLSAILSSHGYTGTNPIADGWLSLNSDGAGNTLVYVNTHDPANQWPSLITVLNNVAPTSLGLADFGYGSSSSSGGTTSGGTTTGGTTGGGTTSGGTTTGGTTTAVQDSAATYTVPSGVDHVVLTGTAAQTITANNLGDTITSNDYGSTIIGGTGNDTLIAGHGHDTLTGGAGSDFFVFNVTPWNAGHITDFTPGTDKIDLSGVLSSYGYTGMNPIADGWLTLNSDGTGNTLVYVNSHDPANQWPSLITTVDHVAPTSLSLSDFGYGSSSSSGGTTTTGGGTTTTGGGTSTTGGGTTTTGPVTETAATYTVGSGVTNVILGGQAPQTITANNLGDTITSNNYGSTIIGGSGNDKFIAGTGADHLTGGAGSDTFVFNSLPTQAGHITDFNTAQDALDLSGIFSSIGYTGTNPLKNNWISFVSDHHGDTNVYVNPHNGTGSHLVTTLDHVLPSSITTSDWIWHH